MDKIYDDINDLDGDLGAKVRTGEIELTDAKVEQSLRNHVPVKPKNSKQMEEKHVFMVNIRYYESSTSEEMTNASFEVRSNHAANALKQRDVASLLADNDQVCKISVDMVNSGIFGADPEPEKPDNY